MAQNVSPHTHTARQRVTLTVATAWQVTTPQHICQLHTHANIASNLHYLHDCFHVPSFFIFWSALNRGRKTPYTYVNISFLLFRSRSSWLRLTWLLVSQNGEQRSLNFLQSAFVWYSTYISKCEMESLAAESSQFTLWQNRGSIFTLGKTLNNTQASQTTLKT